MSAEQTWLDKLNHTQRETIQSADEIQQVAGLLYAVGNESVADRLMAASHRLMRAYRQSQAAVTSRLDADYAEAKANVGGILNSLLETAKG